MEALLLIRPCLPVQLLDSFISYSIAPHATDAFELLASTHFNQLPIAGKEGNQARDIAVNEWISVWIQPMKKAMDQASSEHRKRIVDLLVPRVVVRFGSPVIIALIGASSQDHDAPDASVSTAMAVCRAVRTHCPKLIPLLKDSLSDALLRAASHHNDPSTRLDALGLLCLSAKPSDPVLVSDLNQLKFFLPLNTNIQSQGRP